MLHLSLSSLCHLRHATAILVPLLSFGIAACEGNDAVRHQGTGGTTGTGGMGGIGGTTALSCGTTDPSLAGGSAAELFGRKKIPVFDLYLPADAWVALQANARDEEYVPADACIDGKGIGRVGLRFKGSYGSLFNCFDAAGQNTCRKLGMKIKFDEYVDKQRLFGLSRLNFQGYRYDSSYMKEALSYDIYRATGIVAPRASWALLRVNGEARGLFGMVEEIDKRLVKDRWPDNADGNLFKELWPGQIDEATLVSRLETNTSAPDVIAFKAFSQALNAAPSDSLRTTLGSYFDLNYFARFMAVDDAIANYDGLTTFYTNGSPDQAGNHNYYIYQESPHRFTLIPWDLESTLSLASGYGNVPYWQTTPADCTVQYAVWNGSNQVIAPGCDRVLQALAANLDDYRAATRQLLDGPFSLETMTAKIDQIASFIRAEAAADPHGPGAAEFERAVGYIKQDLPRLRARLQHLSSGEPSQPFVLQTTGINDIESADDYGLVDGTFLMSNPATTMSVEVAKDTPLNGARSLRIRFNFGNDPQPWNQWIVYSVPFVRPPTDLTGLTGIRMKIRSNASRSVRLDLNSPKNSKTDLGIQVGWDLPVTTETTTVSVRLSDARTPSWATDPGDSLTAILQTGTGLTFRPDCRGRDGSGQLPAGVTDNGWVTIDDIELY